MWHGVRDGVGRGRGGTEPILACLNAGDAIVYDARALHWGRGYGRSDNDDGSAAFGSRPVLVLRWDAHTAPAPGGGLIQTALNHRLGTAISAYSGLTTALRLFWERRERPP